MLDEDRPLFADLEDRLRARGLGRVADEVSRLARPAIRLSLTRTEENDIPAGMSKVGGTADLPPGVEWPGWRGGPLPFIAQVRMEEMAALDPEGDLPHHGLLSFFYSLNNPDGELGDGNDPTAWRALYTENAMRAERRPLPDALAERLDTLFPACAVAFSRRLTLPDSETAVVRALGLTNDERLAYIDLVGGSSASFETEMDHRLLGYPYTLEPDPFLGGYLARSGIERPSVPDDPAREERRQRAMAELQEAAKEWHPPAGGIQSRADIWRSMLDLGSRVNLVSLLRAVHDLEPTPAPADFQSRMAALRRATEEEWRLLLQVYTNEEAEMDWAGGGVIHFGIPAADLAARDFSRVWVNLDFL